MNNPSISGDPVEIIAWQIATISQLTGPTGYTGPTGVTGPAATGAYIRHEFIAEDSQTIFNVPYNVGFVDVYYNGTLLQLEQYIANDGSTIILNSPSIAGDPVVIISWEIATISQLTGPTGPAATGAFVRYEFIADNGQTIFNVPYNVGYIDVYYNGTLLQINQYTADDGSTVVLSNPSIGGDPVVIISWELASISQLTGPTGHTGVTGPIGQTGPFGPTGPLNAAGGITGSIQFNNGIGGLSGRNNLIWDNTNSRLGVGTSAPVSTIQYNYTSLESSNASILTNDTIVLDSIPVPELRSAHYYVQVTDEDHSIYHITQMTMVHDGLHAYKSEYNIVTTSGKLGEFDVLIQSGNVDLLFTPYISSNKTIKVNRSSMSV